MALLLVTASWVAVWLMPAQRLCVSLSCGPDWNRNQVSIRLLSFLTWEQLGVLVVGVVTAGFITTSALRRR